MNALLNEPIARYQLGREANPRWVRIIPADPAKEGANWKVSHSSRTVPICEVANAINAINRVTPELQKVCDLKS